MWPSHGGFGGHCRGVATVVAQGRPHHVNPAAGPCEDGLGVFLAFSAFVVVKHSRSVAGFHREQISAYAHPVGNDLGPSPR
jgi:hypothetical protein